MQFRKKRLYSTVLSFMLFPYIHALAADNTPTSHIHRGTVVTISAEKLVVQGLSEKKKDHIYEVAPAAMVLCEGKPCKLSDLKVGELVTITTEKPQDGRALATKIEAKKVGNGTESP